MCACQDSPCAHKLSGAFAKWTNTNTAPSNVTPAEANQLEEVNDAYNQCMEHAMNHPL